LLARAALQRAVHGAVSRPSSPGSGSQRGAIQPNRASTENSRFRE
jgi:hypothetical protein